MNVNVVCPHCFKVNRIPKKESYAKANCGQCKNSLLDAKPMAVDADKLGTFLANSEIPVVVDFWAPWCGPCQSMASAFAQAAQQLEPNYRLAKVDTEAEQMLGAQYGIRSIPTLAIFKNGQEVARQAGAMGAEDIKRWVQMQGS